MCSGHQLLVLLRKIKMNPQKKIANRNSGYGCYISYQLAVSKCNWQIDAENLPEGQMSVGVHVEVKHLAATPIKAEVRVRAEVLEVVKNRVSLSIEA